MKFKKWLKHLDTTALECNIWMDYEKTDGTLGSDIVYVGSMYDIPYWLVDYELCTDEDGEAISWRHQIRATMDDEGGTPGLEGFVITLKEKEN